MPSGSARWPPVQGKVSPHPVQWTPKVRKRSWNVIFTGLFGSTHFVSILVLLTGILCSLSPRLPLTPLKAACIYIIQSLFWISVGIIVSTWAQQNAHMAKLNTPVEVSLPSSVSCLSLRIPMGHALPCSIYLDTYLHQVWVR